ncbi:hypothetical protein ABH931_000646 [Streptacidiphilus sp. MAP12-33]|uniref:peptidoglycan-binding domain-containing protein n=1 Tax=Streptacidiphilus sp. MAP12-33 TaxID=3156266 RepID=UPI003516D51D
MMAFGPVDGDGDGRTVGHRAGSDDETTVLPPVDGDPALVRPYVRGPEPEAPDSTPRTPAAELGQAAWAQGLPEVTETPDPTATTVLPPVPAGPPAHVSAQAPLVPPLPLPVSAPLPAAGGRAQARRAASPHPAKRGRVLALTGGAVALVLIGTGAAYLTRPSSTAPSAQAVAPSTEVASSTPSGPASPSAPASHSAKPSHSAKASPKPSPKPSSSHKVTASASASPSATPSSATTTPSGNGGNGGDNGGGSLGPGSTGAAVVQLQQDLREVHIDRHLYPSGVYDQQTAEDVVMFQACENVTDDPAGVYGPATQAAMQDALQNGLNC